MWKYQISARYIAVLCADIVIFNLFYDAVITSYCMTPYDPTVVNADVGRLWKEATLII
jgi:hypothetical protein